MWSNGYHSLRHAQVDGIKDKNMLLCGVCEVGYAFDIFPASDNLHTPEQFERSTLHLCILYSHLIVKFI